MTDKRFDKVYSDPRFMVAPKKVTKVKIDKRFEGMFKKKEFNVVAKVDKYGRRIDKKDNYALQNYYKHDSSGSEENDADDEEDGEDEESFEEEMEEEAEGSAKSEQDEENPDSSDVGKKYYDSDGKFHWSGESSSGSDSEEKAEKERKQARKDKAKKKKDEKKKHAKNQAEGTESDHSIGSQEYDSASYSDDVSGVWSLENDGEDGKEDAA